MEWLQNVWDYVNELNAVSIIIRVIFAALAGGAIGFEREYHGRAAGLRTHILVSLGAALCAMIGVWLTAGGFSSDVQRTGAQVMSGVGFLGAGTILLKRSNSRITGLTTAAGLWATAAIGLAVGYGLYEAAFVTVLVIILTFTLVSRIEYLMNSKRQRIFAYVEVKTVDDVPPMITKLRADFSAVEVQVTPPRSGISPHVGMEALIRLPARASAEENLEALNQLEQVVFALHIN